MAETWLLFNFINPAQDPRRSLTPNSDALRLSTVPKTHLPRLSSKHPPIKENMPTTMPMAVPAKNGGE